MNAKTKPSFSLRPLFLHRGFAQFWFTRLGTTTANQMLMVALGWHMYDLTSSAWDLGLVGLFQFVPALLLTLPAGHVADRVHRGRIIAGCTLLQAATALLLALATQGHFVTRTWILGLSIALGVARAFQMPAQQALIALLVPGDLLQRAITVNSATLQIAIICGPALGGALYILGPTTVYLCCAALLIWAGVLALRLQYAHRPAALATTWSSVLAGVHFVWTRKVILGASSLDLFAVLLGGATALLPIYARDLLQVGPIGLGLLRSAPAAGALLMSGLLVRWPLQRHVGSKTLWAVAFFGVATVLFGVSHSFALSLLALALTGVCDSISVVTRTTLIQVETPDAMRGRVAAVNSIFIGASNQLGEFESGAVAALWGPVASVVSGGLGTVLIAAAWLRLFPDLATRDRMDALTP